MLLNSSMVRSRIGFWVRTAQRIIRCHKVENCILCCLWYGVLCEEVLRPIWSLHFVKLQTDEWTQLIPENSLLKLKVTGGGSFRHSKGKDYWHYFVTVWRQTGTGISMDIGYLISERNNPLCITPITTYFRYLPWMKLCQGRPACVDISFSRTRLSDVGMLVSSWNL